MTAIPYLKDTTNHGGFVLVNVNNKLLHKRRPDLGIFWDDDVWIEIVLNNQQFLLDTFYSPKP